MEPSAVGMKKNKAEKVYPKFNIGHEYVPESKKLEVGKTYKLEMKVKVVGLSISRFSNETEFEIQEFEVCSGEKNKEE